MFLRKRKTKRQSSILRFLLGTEVKIVFSISYSIDSSLLKIQTWQSYSCATKLRETVSMMMRSEMKIVFWFSYSRKTKVENSPNITVTGGVRVVVVHLILIPNWKLKIKNSQSWFSMFDSSRIENHKFTISIVNFCF